MTTAELHTILDDENKKLSLAELQQVIYDIKQDCIKMTYKLIDDEKKRTDIEEYIFNSGYYCGEQNAFQIALDLLEHLEV